MARRYEKKYKKYLASRTFGGGNVKNRRGSGCRGGVGRAGARKHKWLQTLKNEPDYYGRHGFSQIPSQLRKRKKIQDKLLKVSDISSLIAEKKLKEKEGLLFIEFEGKILGTGSINVPVFVKASSFSKSAKEKIEKVGGRTEVLNRGA